MLPARPRTGERRLTFVVGADPCPLRRVVPGRIADVGANRHVLRAELLHPVIDVIEKRSDVACTAEEARYTTYPDEAAGVADGANGVVGFSAEMFIEPGTRGVTRDHRPL